MGDLKKRYNAVMTDADAVIANSQFIATTLPPITGLTGPKVHVVPRALTPPVSMPKGFNPNRMVDVAA